jgi:peptidyl-dipeptidase A
VSDADRLVALLEAKLRPLDTALAEAWWDTNTHASPEAAERRERIELERRELLGDPDAFGAIEAARRKADRFEPLVARQLDVLHDAFAPHQIDAELRRRIVELEVEVETTFNTFRGEIDGQRVDDNAIADVLRTSNDSATRRAAWEAAKQVGAEVAERVRELARLRNEAARKLGYRDHFALALATSELDDQRLFATLDEVDRATAAPFDEWKARLDAALSARISGAVDLDPLFEHADVEALTVRSYDGLGLDTRPVLAHSDLYAREGKSQHAFCIHVDREGDVRVLCNIEPNERWTETMLHEFGHAVYDRELDDSLPWLLREPAHALTTEGVAMLFGRLARNPRWLTTVAGIGTADVEALTARLGEARRAALLVFARWVLVMTNFERGLYADPDADHDARWWDLVEQFQRVRRPDGRHAPDWAAKIHLTVAPVYYQNYLYGELVASQLQATLDARAGGVVDEPAAGRLLVDEVFRPGASLRWDRLVERATGEPLTAAHLARQLAA